MEFTVVLVDDDPVVLFLHQILIKRGEFDEQTFSFKDGKKALDFITRNKEKAPFLVLLDINMPVMNGWEFLDALREDPVGGQVFVAIVSSSINSYDLEKAGNYVQVVEYLEKPVSKGILIDLHKKATALVLKNK